MSMQVSRESVWVAAIPDEPGGLAAKLTSLAEAGANLKFVVARREHEHAGSRNGGGSSAGDAAGVGGSEGGSGGGSGGGVVFVTPIEGDRQHNAATVAGFHASRSMHAVVAEGPDRAGLGEVITTRLAEAGINLRGLAAASIDGRCVMHLTLDSEAAADRAAELVKHVR